MPTTFTVLSLGRFADLDTREGNYTAENAGSLVGVTAGGSGDPLSGHAATWSAVGSVGSYYNQNGHPAERFSIDGGPPQTFDSSAVYMATLTYADGSTATLSAVIAQDTAGNTYLMPEYSDNADQATLEAGMIQSISFDALIGNTYSGLSSSRESWDVVTCFAAGTRIRTANGDRPVDGLQPGMRVHTLDHGLQPLRWVGCRAVPATGAFAPILFRAGAIGNHRDLRLSPQHRVLLTGWRAELHAGTPEALVAARHMVNDRDILRAPGGTVRYYHLLLDRHQLIWSEGALSESFHPGQVGLAALDHAARDEVLALFPQLAQTGAIAYGPAARPVLRAHEARLSVP